jgi:membrane protein DedA with SNARE-associated domain
MAFPFPLAADAGPLAVLAAAFLVPLLAGVALPLPASLTLVAAGVAAGAGVVAPAAVLAAAYAGAILGDLAGHALGARAGPWLQRRLAGRDRALALQARAAGAMQRQGPLAVFLTRWAAAPLGPWVSLAAGAGGLPRGRFLAAALPGRALWVAATAGGGWLFGTGATAGPWPAVLAAAAAALVLALALTRRRPRPHPEGSGANPAPAPYRGT